MFIRSIAVLSNELDASYRHLHHAGICLKLEAGRLALLEAAGYPNESMMEQGLFLVLSRLEVHYLREVRDGEHKVTCESLRLDGKRFIMSQRLILSSQKDAVRAVVECQALSRESGRAVPLPPDMFRAMESLTIA